MLIYRVCRTRYADRPFDGAGGRHVPGRWHHVGTEIAYASESASTAALEVLMNVQTQAAAREARSLIVAEIPDDEVLDLPEADWPPGWDGVLYTPATQTLGTDWIRGMTSLGLRVPSTAHQPRSPNVLINPAHPSFDRLRRISTEPFVFNPRLVEQLPA